MTTRYQKEVIVKEVETVTRTYTIIVEVEDDDDDAAEVVARNAVEYGEDWANDQGGGRVVEWSEYEETDHDHSSADVYDRGEVEYCDECGNEDACCVCWVDDEGEENGEEA